MKKRYKFKDSVCVNRLKDNQCLAFPTETVFGLGCIANSEEAFLRLVALKRRPPEKPFTLMLSNREEIAQYADINEPMKRLIDAFMPGEITLLLPAKKAIAPWISLHHPTIGVRVSGSKAVCDLIARVGSPLLVTSANQSGHAPCLNAEETEKEFFGEDLAIIDGDCSSNIPSTIVMCLENEVQLIRQGTISFAEIQKVWEEKS